MADENTDDIKDDVIEEDTQEDVQLDDDVQESKVEKRIRQLSNKVKLTSKERDELVKAKKTLETERDSAKKEAEFYSAFSDTTDKYPAAKEYKNKIKEKVLGGYSVEDAAVAVLAKEGKLTMPQSPKDNPAGGSATNPPATGESKPLSEMSREEKRTEVLKAIDRGDISFT
jgi:hypothetical protein